MAIPTTGPMRFSEIKSTLNGSNSFNNYHVTPGGVTPATTYPRVSATGMLAFSMFREQTAPPGTTAGRMDWNDPGQYTFVIPRYNVMTWTANGAGAGSAGCVWRGSNGAGGTDIMRGKLGVPGLSTFILGPSGTVTANPMYFKDGYGTDYYFLYDNNVRYPVDPTVTDARLTALGGGDAGGGNLLPDRTPKVFNGRLATNSGGSVINPTGEDQVIVGGGGAGGIGAYGYIDSRVPYTDATAFDPNNFKFGPALMGRGADGGKGGKAVKVFRPGDPGAPVPGETWTIIVGRRGNTPDNMTTYSPHTAGGNGSASAQWS